MRSMALFGLALFVTLAAAGARDQAVRPAFEIPSQYRLIDGIATNGSTIWVSSVVDRVVLEHRGKDLRAFPIPADAGRPRGLAYDVARNLLWVATDCPAIVDAGPCTNGALLALDRDGKVRKRLVTHDGQPHFFSTVAVDPYQVTVTDARNGDVFVCRNECDFLHDNTAAASDNGAVAIDAHDQRTLGETRQSRRASPSPFSGIAIVGNHVVAGQRLGNRSSVFAFQMGAKGPTNLTTLAQGDAVPEPGQISGYGTKAYVVADSQWSSYDARQTASRPQHPTPILILSVPQ